MDIKKLDDKCFELTDPDGSVSFNLPGYIVLITGAFNQLFRNTRNLEYTHLSSVYQTVDRVMQDAECYTEGVTNKEKFLKAIKNPAFLEKHNIKEADQEFLRQFIIKTKHTPPAIVQQLYMRGYGNVVDDIDFADPTEELKETCEIFFQFVRHVKQQT